MGKEMELDLIKQYSQVFPLTPTLDYYNFSYCCILYPVLSINLQVERVFADRATKVDGDDVVPEYLVKWQGLPYAESTW